MNEDFEDSPRFIIPDTGDWRYRLNEYTRLNQRELAALAWGLWVDQGDDGVIIGVDLHPAPHFFSCSREVIRTLNNQVEHQLKSALAVVESHNPSLEVLVLGINQGSDYQFQFIQFQPDPAPPLCFEQLTEPLSNLISQLEAGLAQHLVNVTST